jgi:hypothetical protein
LKVLEVAHSPQGYTVAIVDDPVDGSAKVVVIHDSSSDAVVLDLDSLIVMEALEITGASQSARLVDAVREFLDDSDG